MRSKVLFDNDNRPTAVLADFLRDIKIPGEDLASIDAELQKRFFQKDPVTQKPLERWELKEVEMSCSADRIRQHLAACGFVNATEPSCLSYDYAAWPGALAARSAVRAYDLINAWLIGVRWRQTVVFTGSRPLDWEKEDFFACCEVLNLVQLQPHVTNQQTMLCVPIAARTLWQKLKPRTEADMMRFLWKIMDMPEDLRALPTEFIDAPMKPGNPPVRPNTEDPLHLWLAGKPEPGSMLVSSGAPYGMAQDEAFRMILSPHGHSVETFGHKAPDLPIENLMRELAGTANRIRRARKA